MTCQEPAIPSPILPCPAFVPVRSLILLPSISPRNPLFCSPITLLSSPAQTSCRLPPLSLSPSSLLHSLPLALVVADSSSASGRDCTDVLMLSPAVRVARPLTG